MGKIWKGEKGGKGITGSERNLSQDMKMLSLGSSKELARMEAQEGEETDKRKGQGRLTCWVC